jgi:hypothetical protein
MMKSLVFSKRGQLVVFTLLLILIAASRILQIKTLQMDYDDAWSIWQTFGSPAEIIRWTPFDWPPLYFLSLGAWKEIAGIDPFALRYFSILVFLIGVPCLYRAVRRTWNEQSALTSCLVYGALGYVLYLSFFLRSYGLLLSLMILAWWLTLRYFDHPGWRRGVVLALCLIGMFYYHYTSVLAFGILGLYTIFVYPRRVWRWGLPVLLLSLATVPHLLAKQSVFATRTTFSRNLALPPLGEALLKLAQTLLGVAFPYLALLFAIATVLIVIARVRQIGQVQKGLRFVALALWCLSPISLYLLQSKIGLFQDPRYLWWVLPGLALWLGCGLALLPRALNVLALASLLCVMFWPQALDPYATLSPFGDNFRLLRESLRAGDVLLLDPRCERNCGAIEAWDYFTRYYFPEGLTFVNSPAGHRRVWYISINWNEDPDTIAFLKENYIPDKYFGPPSFFFQLYMAPPDPTGILFENGLRFHGAELDEPVTPYGPVFRDGQTVHLRLWWSVDKALPLNYSRSLLLFVNNVPAVQIDSPPQPKDAPQDTSQWRPGQYYVEDQAVRLPTGLVKDAYTFYLAVYYWEQPDKRFAPLGVATPALVPNQTHLLPIQTIDVQTWN